ncbi:hypothetical protein DOY81_010495 [Sarcophaga bullata]|nr:hypothetical protein DOY81_010495 [Sarcophaga bullata]
MDDSKDSGSFLSKISESRYSFILPSCEKSRSPGPAIYGPSNISLVKSASPQFSIYPRLNSRKPKNQVPAANAYDRSNYKPGKSAPSYSFGRRYTNRSLPITISDYVKL